MTATVVDGARARVESLRPVWDRVLRAHRRYTAANGDALAGALTYALLVGAAPAVLLVTTVLSVTGTGAGRTARALHGAAARLLPGEVAGAVDALRPHLPGLRLALLALLVWTSLRLVRATRTAVRAMCGQNAGSGNPVRDALLDAALGAAFVASVAALVAVVAALDPTPAWRPLVRAAVVWLLAVGLMLRASWPLPGRPSAGAAARAAAGAAVLVELLTLAAGRYFAATAGVHDDVYHSVGTLVGVLVWCSLVARVLLRATAWASTAGTVPTAPGGGS